MIRFAWLQARNQTLIAYALLAALAVAALITGIQLSHLYDSLVAHCQSSCGLATNAYLSRYSFMDKTLDILARAVPLLVGLFWGAPLLGREFETGTYRLAWTQSVPRRRWLLTKIGVGALATLGLAALFSLTVTWWYHSRDKVGSTAYGVFDRRDIAPVAYALFAFAVGVMFGALIRRTVSAMVATLGLFVLARIVVSIWVRPHLLAAKHVIVGLQRSGPVQLGIGSSNGGAMRIFTQGGGPENSWTQSGHLIAQSGQRVSSAQMSAFLHQYCPDIANHGPGQGTASNVRVVDPAAQCLDQVQKTFKLAVSYQPAGRYWTFQWLEAAIFILLALAAIGVTYGWVLRRRS